MEEHILKSPEGIGTILKRSHRPFLISRRNSSSAENRPPVPERLCPDCGKPLRAVFMDHPAYLAATGNTPHWTELPCESCERERVLAEIEERAGAGERGRLGRLLADSMLQRRFVGKTFENFSLYGGHQDRQAKILAYAKTFADDFTRHRDAGTWLLFVGNTGTGKGHLCAAIINRIIQSGWSALFTKTPRLLREIKDTFTRDAEVTQSEILLRMGELDLLVIDRLFEGESRILFFDWESYRRFNHQGTNEGMVPGSSPELFPIEGKMR